MRTLPSSRGMPFKLRSTTRHLWIGDQSGTSDNIRDICGYGGNCLPLTQVASPGVCAAFGAAGGRTLNGSSQYFYASDGGSAGTSYTAAIHLKCDDDAANTTIIDSSPNALSCALSGSTSAAFHVAGKTGTGGLAVTGGYYIDCGNPSALQNSTKKICGSFWMKYDGAVDYGYILGKGTTTTGWGVYSTSDGYVHFYINHFTNNDAIVSVATDNAWHHIYFCYDGDAASNQIRIWRDTVEGTAATLTDTISDDANMLVAFRTGWDAFGHSLDAIWVCNSFPADPTDLLTPLYNAGSGTDETTITI